MSTKPLIVLMDSGNTLYRMFHTQPPRSNRNDERTESASGLINAIKRFQNGYEKLRKAEKVIAFFDYNGPTFRDEISGNYKDDREGMPADLKPQEPLAIKALGAYGVPCIIKEGVEADDSMAMVAFYYRERGYEVVMVTTDKDMTQLITDGISIYNPSTCKIVDEEAVIKKFGVTPSKMAEFLAISGDKIDGIIGIEGAGPKTVAKWLNKYGTIDNLIDSADEVKGVVGERLRAFSASIKNNMRLTVIKSDPELLTEEEINEIENKKPDIFLSNQMASEYGLSISIKEPSKTIKPVSNPEPPKAVKEKKKAKVVDDEPQQGFMF